MSFSVIKQWDNRGKKVIINPQTGRSWTRRITWLENSEDQVKLKMETCGVEGNQYREVIAVGGFAQTIWERFKQGQSIEDSVSILANPVPKYQQSRKASEENS